MKLVVDATSDRVVGCHIVGDAAARDDPARRHRGEDEGDQERLRRHHGGAPDGGRRTRHACALPRHAMCAKRPRKFLPVMGVAFALVRDQCGDTSIAVKWLVCRSGFFPELRSRQCRASGSGSDVGTVAELSLHSLKPAARRWGSRWSPARSRRRLPAPLQNPSRHPCLFRRREDDAGPCGIP